MTADVRHAVRNSDTCKAIAPVECIIADARYAVGNLDAFQHRATREYTPANARHAVRYHDACKAIALVECIIADARHAITDRDASKETAPLEGTLANVRHAVRNSDICKLTSVKRIIADALTYTSFLKHNRRDRSLIENICWYLCYVSSNCDGKPYFSICLEYGTVRTQIVHLRGIKINLGKPRATGKCTANTCHTVRNRNTRKATTATKRIVCHAVWNYKICY